MSQCNAAKTHGLEQFKTTFLLWSTESVRWMLTPIPIVYSAYVYASGYVHIVRSLSMFNTVTVAVHTILLSAVRDSED